MNCRQMFAMIKNDGDWFTKNFCRICKQMLCCENCLANHQINRHKETTLCLICYNGFVQLSKNKEAQLLHLEQKHLPLYCFNCNMNLYNKSDMIQHDMCLVRKVANRRIKTNASLFKTSTPRAVILAIAENPVKNHFTNVMQAPLPLKEKSLKKVTFQETLVEFCLAESTTSSTMNISKESSTIWESAISQVDNPINSTSNKLHKDVKCIASTDSKMPNNVEGFWNSVSNAMKTIMSTVPVHLLKRKRCHLNDDDLIEQKMKRLKLSDIRGRKPIH